MSSVLGTVEKDEWDSVSLDSSSLGYSDGVVDGGDERFLNEHDKIRLIHES